MLDVFNSYIPEPYCAMMHLPVVATWLDSVSHQMFWSESAAES